MTNELPSSFVIRHSSFLMPLPGFRDFYPADCARRNYILAQWRSQARRYGFVEFDGPVLEPMALYEKNPAANSWASSSISWTKASAMWRCGPR